VSPRAAATPDSAGFTGFADANARFFRALAKNQNREWFLAHKDEYERGWLQPMKHLLTEVRYTLERGYPCELGEPKVFRIHRDTRFSNDKSPYKTQVAGYVPVAGPRGPMGGPVALYLHLGTETYVGAGHWVMEPAQLARFRAALLDERRGGALARLLTKLEKAGFTAGSREALKKVPRGVDPEHPRAELLKRKGLVIEYPSFDRELIVSRALVDWLVKQSRRAAPLVEWLLRLGEDSPAPTPRQR
jgi:uncharacterized protein (TIGR02453 family)